MIRRKRQNPADHPVQESSTSVELCHKSSAIYLIHALKNEQTSSLTFKYISPENSGVHCVYCPECRLTIQLYEAGTDSKSELNAKKCLDKDPLTGIITLYVSYSEVLNNVTQIVEKIKWFINTLKLDS